MWGVEFSRVNEGGNGLVELIINRKGGGVKIISVKSWGGGIRLSYSQFHENGLFIVAHFIFYH